MKDKKLIASSTEIVRIVVAVNKLRIEDHDFGWGGFCYCSLQCEPNSMIIKSGMFLSLKLFVGRDIYLCVSKVVFDIMPSVWYKEVECRGHRQVMGLTVYSPCTLFVTLEAHESIPHKNG